MQPLCYLGDLRHLLHAMLRLMWLLMHGLSGAVMDVVATGIRLLLRWRHGLSWHLCSALQLLSLWSIHVSHVCPNGGVNRCLHVLRRWDVLHLVHRLLHVWLRLLRLLLLHVWLSLLRLLLHV